MSSIYYTDLSIFGLGLAAAAQKRAATLTLMAEGRLPSDPQVRVTVPQAKNHASAVFAQILSGEQLPLHVRVHHSIVVARAFQIVESFYEADLGIVEGFLHGGGTRADIGQVALGDADFYAEAARALTVACAMPDDGAPSVVYDWDKQSTSPAWSRRLASKLLHMNVLFRSPTGALQSLGATMPRATPEADQIAAAVVSRYHEETEKSLALVPPEMKVEVERWCNDQGKRKRAALAVDEALRINDAASIRLPESAVKARHTALYDSLFEVAKELVPAQTPAGV